MPIEQDASCPNEAPKAGGINQAVDSDGGGESGGPGGGSGPPPPPGYVPTYYILGF